MDENTIALAACLSRRYLIRAVGPHAVDR
jgi:hypothetical protein